jgi:hypothetical protein
MQHDAHLIGPQRDVVQGSFHAPEFFLQKLSYIAVISAAIVLTFTGLGVWDVVSHYLIRFAEERSVSISTALASSGGTYSSPPHLKASAGLWHRYLRIDLRSATRASGSS